MPLLNAFQPPRLQDVAVVVSGLQSTLRWPMGSRNSAEGRELTMVRSDF
ncbi:hypothetical protein Pan44_16940 [Caulifigura coniformis]|uniref:Uncharacterized protein n=1 Tax=Caulifigura coniformis TaxID=2527983 RepID=A0A517SC11_9PLAN|nr:hypothetical protein [Caulifigura coniformis]QDT53671.1 hypothetical protein Pan44_16940 [Caulifigura coniformis]